MSIKYWWSDDFQWFCILTDDGTNQTTVSLTREEAEALSSEADPKWADMLAEGRKRTLKILDDDRATGASAVSSTERPPTEIVEGSQS